MTQFAYESRDTEGRSLSGVIAAQSAEEAGRMLREKGQYVVEIREAGGATQDDDLYTVEQHARRVKRQDVIFFAHQMAVMIQTGVPLAEALECTAMQAPNASFRAVLQDVARSVQGGTPFSAALGQYPRVFPKIMIALMGASEASGTMGEMLERISTYMGKEARILRQVRGAMLYPLVMLTMAVSVTVFLLIFVLPRFATIYQSRGSALPLPTQILMTASNVVIGYWPIWLGLLVLAIVGIVVALSTEGGRRGFDWLKLNTPILRTMFRSLYVARASRTMGTMIVAGVSMLEAVAIVRGVTNNSYYRALWDEVDGALQEGLQLSDPLMKTDLIPRSITQMIRSGEHAGRLGHVLEKVAEFTELEFDESVKTTTQMIEPIMIATMGGLVGFVAIALLLPIFSIGNVMAK